MAINFPTSGLVAGTTTYTYANHTWLWSGTVWQSVGTAQGVQGIQGFPGQGIQGPAGSVQGIQGIQGLQGFGYAQLQGTTGNQGTQGIQGSSSGYTAPTIGSTLIGSGSTVTTIAGLTLTTPAIGNFILGYTSTVTAAGTTTLTNTSNNQQLFTGTSTQTVVMPVASTMTVGTRYVIENNSTGNITVNSSGSNLIATVLPGTSIKITCISTSGTDASSWDYEFVGFNFLTGTGSVVLSTSPTISNPSITGTLTAATITTSGSVSINGKDIELMTIMGAL